MPGRISANKTLADLLPAGAEGGKEFARLVDLLLFHDARRRGETLTLINDDAGDYAGLDGIGRSVRIGQMGYQYKFFASPFSNAHRTAIKKSMAAALASAHDSKIDRWILVTPENLLESVRRKGGGDVSWFLDLQAKAARKSVVLEHWGHKQLQALFAETPSLALFYYPSLVPRAVGRRKTLHEVLARYEANLFTTFGRIQFVGMSVYKPEATKGIALNDIYIPLTLVAEDVDEDATATLHINPLATLEPGACNVVLGDPGSGKSTLLRFLALSGKSGELQAKFAARPDPERLPILVTLRRYADELKSRPLLGILDYIVESTQADFSLKGADLDFFEAFLEAGRAVLCFDGLDELPSPHFKAVVRDRIMGLLDSYPFNTCIVTSRVVGYDASFRFDDRRFGHYKVGKLQLPEIEQFIADWYSVREESERTRSDNVAALVRVIRDPEHDAIRALAKNPLLLTIIALVHRIDAVLPDERVVLYTKCTETLLNTWHTWKFRASDETVSRGKAERRNKLRVEAVAHWMQTLSVAERAEQRAVVSAVDAERFLAHYIEAVEKPTEVDTDAHALAANFLDFVRQRAGLVIEVGDQRYSFVHLTFQEYLAASYIVTASERGGAEALWDSIKENTAIDRWQETIRLLIASLRSGDTRGFIVDAVIRQSVKDHSASRAMLLLGCLLDGIDEAEERAADILRLAIIAAAESNDAGDITRIVARGQSAADRLSTTALTSVAVDQLCHNLPSEHHAGVMIVAAATIPVAGDWLAGQEDYVPWMRLLASDHAPLDRDRSLLSSLHRYTPVVSAASRTDPDHNLAASAAIVLALSVDSDAAVPIIAQTLLINSLWAAPGPFHDLGFNLAIMALPSLINSEPQRSLRRTAKAGFDKHYDILKIVLDVIDNVPDDNVPDDSVVAPPAPRTRVPDLGIREAITAVSSVGVGKQVSWSRIWGDTVTRTRLVAWLVASLNLEPSPQWHAALMSRLTSINFALLFANDRARLEDPAARAQLFAKEPWRLVFLLFDFWFRLYDPHSAMAVKVGALASAATIGDLTPHIQLANALRQAAIGKRGATTALKDLLRVPELSALLRDVKWSHRKKARIE